MPSMTSESLFAVESDKRQMYDEVAKIQDVKGLASELRVMEDEEFSTQKAKQLASEAHLQEKPAEPQANKQIEILDQAVTHDFSKLFQNQSLANGDVNVVIEQL